MAPICRGNAMAAMTRSAAAAKTAEISSLRETPAHQDGNSRTSRQYGRTRCGVLHLFSPALRW